MGIAQRRVALAVLALAVLVPAASHAETAQKDGLRVSVRGKMAPLSLPRRAEVPVAVSISTHIVLTRAGALPKLRRIAIAINSNGRLREGSVPVCRIGHIEPATTAEALAACRRSLVGEGHFSAQVRIPEQSPFPSAGRVLIFNGRLRGEPAIFAHVYGTEPVPTSYVLAFEIGHARGTFGTVLEASLPAATGEWGYVTGVSLHLDPEFAVASCPAPAGFPGAVFPLMRTSFAFAGGPTIGSTLTRSCRVRG